MKRLMMVVVFVLFPQVVRAADDPRVGAEMPNYADDGSMYRLSQSSIPVSTSVSLPVAVVRTDSIVYVINKGPYNIVKVSEDGGTKVHDTVTSHYIGQFGYRKCTGVSLLAKVSYSHGRLFPKTVYKTDENSPERFEGKEGWLWIFEDGKEPYRTHDMSILKDLLKK